MSPCPQPGKSKYPTKNAAISADRFHLSTKKPES